MKKQVRIGVFETNSSSTHSLVVCTKEEYDKWKSGELYYLQDVWGINDDLKKQFKNTTFITKEEKDLLIQNGLNEYDVKTFDKWGRDYEEEENHYTTKSGEELIIRSYFGYDG